MTVCEFYFFSDKISSFLENFIDVNKILWTRVPWRVIKIYFNDIIMDNNLRM